MNPHAADLNNTSRFKTALTAALLIEGHLSIPQWPIGPLESWPRGHILHIGPWYESSLSLALQVKRGQTWAQRLSSWTNLQLDQQNWSSEMSLTKSFFKCKEIRRSKPYAQPCIETRSFELALWDFKESCCENTTSPLPHPAVFSHIPLPSLCNWSLQTAPHK